MVCCVLTAAILAYVGRFFRRLTGRGDVVPAPKRPPAPTRVEVSLPDLAGAADERVLVGVDA